MHSRIVSVRDDGNCGILSRVQYYLVCLNNKKFYEIMRCGAGLTGESRILSHYFVGSVLDE